MKIIQCIVTAVSMLLCLGLSVLPVNADSPELQLNEEEAALVQRTQNGSPISMGIIPHAFPLSDCPPSSSGYAGLNVEMLNKITEISGLTFEYQRLPIENQTPFQTLMEEKVSLVAGTIRLQTFIDNPDLVLSDRLCDGSAICIGERSANPTTPKTGKIAVLYGYQAGIEFSNIQFPLYELALYPSNQDVMKAVRNGEADLAMISRYVGIYELQNPLNENLTELTPYQIERESCVMGLSSPENLTAVAIIDKALEAIGDDGYNYIQMNFSISNPYNLTAIEYIYKYRYILFVVSGAAILLLFLTWRLIYAQKEQKKLSVDSLTGAFSEAGFELAVAKIMSKTSQQLFITDFDVNRFSSYNELNGKAQGDKLLCEIVSTVKLFISEQDIVCRSYADHFKVLSRKESLESLIVDINGALHLMKQTAHSDITINFGVYQVNDRSVPISKMLDFASIAKKHVKNNPETFIGVFDESLLERQISEARMTATFESSLANMEFVPYYQPKFDAATKEIIGAEALVRWKSGDGKLISPAHFIELFEKSGQILQLDFFVLGEVCKFLNLMKAEGIPLLPIAVNFSRVHLYRTDFVQRLNETVEMYGINKGLIEIECTETTMINDTALTKNILGTLQSQGFSIAMDDFGSAYSSLNTLCSIPLDILKLDGKFIAATLSNEKMKANIIISNVMSLAHDLHLKIVAEGVETEEQYLFLKGLGCDFIQGYYFSKPLEGDCYFELLRHRVTPTQQPRLTQDLSI